MSTRISNYFVLQIIVWLLTMLSLSGCSETKKIWKTTKNIYYEYMETQYTIKLNNLNLGDAKEQRLARLLKPVDERIYTLCKFLDGEDQLPKQEWICTLFNRFSWISGVIVVDIQGELLFQYPTDLPKPNVNTLLAIVKKCGSDRELKIFTVYDIKKMIALGKEGANLTALNTTSEKDGNQIAQNIALFEPNLEGTMKMDIINQPSNQEEFEKKLGLQEDQTWGENNKIHAIGSNSTFSSKIYLVQPFFKANAWLGLIIINFDLHNLLKFCSEPDELVVFSLDHILWIANKYHEDAVALIREPWKRILAKQSMGTWLHGNRLFYWFSRLIGRYDLIYAVAIGETTK